MTSAEDLQSGSAMQGRDPDRVSVVEGIVGSLGIARRKEGRCLASRCRRGVILFSAAAMLAGCVSRTAPDMDDSASQSGDAAPERGTRSGQGGGPAGGSLWPELSRTALQTGMGFLHH
ncbi:hypothetical protein [Asaia sp. VD9]|uniref:hypothetical protein n=1 Tax=Asaia sp. VD9 TaxID=3081235 RepID=UPI0030195434